MLSPERKRRLIEIGIFAAPIVLLKITALIFGGAAPAEADAAGGGNGAAGAVGAGALEAISWSPEQIAAAAYVEQLRELPFGASPMRYNVERDPVVVVDDPEPTEAPLEVTVTGILESSGQSVALLNGKAYRVGQPVGADGWHVTEIDVGRRIVRFKNIVTKETTTRSLPAPR